MRTPSLPRAAYRLTGTLILLLYGLTVSATPAAAECNPPGADTSFRLAVPFAARVVIGTVVDVRPDGFGGGPGGRSTHFTMVVTRVLRGDAPDTLVVEQLETGGCARWLSASLGDELVLALDTRPADPPAATNTAAWLRGFDPNFETITLAEAVDLVRVRPPATSTASGPGATALACLAGGGIGLALLTVGRRRRAN